MRLIPSDPDIATIVNRIRDGSLDLQPDFQRGAVWSTAKQQLLIDSILRDWYVPPIHVVRTETDNQVVLDGQQRLRSIQDFVDGALVVDGHAEPFSEGIFRLDGKTYEDLPDQNRRRFDRFTLRVFEVIDHEPEEPYELFYRLNQPVVLTSAEKRNAFFGAPREQIRDLAEIAEEAGMTPARIGFSNARLAYEDIIARFVWTLEVRTLAERVTARLLTERYRSGEPFDSRILAWARDALETLFSISSLDSGNVRFNRATTYSWLCFTARALHRGARLEALNEFVEQTEYARNSIRRGTISELYTHDQDRRPLLYAVLNDRATARVTDVTSVILRDAILWILFSAHDRRVDYEDVEALRSVAESAQSPFEAEDAILSAASRVGWDRLS